ncbi:MAG: Sec-independent protein translocase subunit TatA [Actinomycetaceae bacterium]|nr:Sec-independent protein translocase subunit TatA [Actinomycetaceae bacterium]
MRPWHIVVFVIVVLIVFGTAKLPDIARSLGQSAKILKKEMRELQDDEPSGAAPPTQPTGHAQPGGYSQPAGNAQPGGQYGQPQSQPGAPAPHDGPNHQAPPAAPPSPDARPPQQ